MNPQEFKEFLAKLTAGDKAATDDFFATYGPIVRNAAECQLGGTDLQRMCDGSDIRQDVLFKFLKRLHEGRFQFDSPASLEALLIKMMRNKVIDTIRHEAARGAGTRARSPAAGHSSALFDSLVNDSGNSPSQIAADDEILQELRRRLEPDLQQALDLRLRGLTWKEIGVALGISAHAIETRFRHSVREQMRQIDPDFDEG